MTTKSGRNSLPYLHTIEPPNPLDEVLAKIEKYQTAICGLQNEINRLISVQNLAKVHIKKYENDYMQLKSRYMQALAVLREKSNAKPAPAERTAKKQVNAKELEYEVISDNQYYKMPGAVQLLMSIRNFRPIKSICLDSKSLLLAFTDGKNLTLIDMQSCEVKKAVELPETKSLQYVHRCLQFSPDDKYICVALDSQLMLYDSETLENSAQLSLNSDNIVTYLIDLSIDSVIICYRSGNICQIRYSSLDPIKTFRCDFNGPDNTIITGMQLIANQLLISDENGVIIALKVPEFASTSCIEAGVKIQYGFVANPGNGKLIIFSQDQDPNSKTCADFSGDCGVYAMATADNFIALVDSGTSDKFFKIKYHSNTVLDIRHSKLYSSFVTCSADGNVCVWKYNLESPKYQ